MIGALSRALGDLGDPRLRRPLWWSLLGATLLAIGVVVGAERAVALLPTTGSAALDALAHAAGGGLGAVLAWLLYPSLISLIIGLLLEDIVRAVERRHYPDLPPPPNLSFSRDVILGCRLALLSVLTTLFALLLSAILPGINFLIFFAVNSYLFGREYYDQIAARRLDRPAYRALRRRHPVVLWTSGALICLGALTPFVNLLAPVIAAAFMTHVFENLRSRSVLVDSRPAGVQ